MEIKPEPKDWFETKAQVQLFLEMEYACVYLLGPPKGRPLRLGSTRSPGDRISALQDAHWQTLAIHSIVWLAGPPLARRLEREAARLLHGRRLTNHWYDITPDWGMRCLEVAANNQGLPVLSHESMVKTVRDLDERRIRRQVEALA